MLKKLIIVSIISICTLSIFTLSPKKSEAATLPGVYFDSDGAVYVSVLDLGMFINNEWEVLLINNWPDMGPIWAFGFRNYNTTFNAGVQTILEDDLWFGEAGAYVWDGFGTATGYFSDTDGDQWTSIISATPPPSTSTRHLQRRGRK